MFEFNKPKSMTDTTAAQLTEWFRTRFLAVIRDKRTCQQEGCGYKESANLWDKNLGWYKESKLTVHHIVHREEFKEKTELAEQLGYGMDDLVNLVTLCETCHVDYHRGAITLNIRGQLYNIGTSRPKMNFFEMKKRRKKLIKENKHLGKPLSWSMLAMLMHRRCQ